MSLLRRLSLRTVLILLLLLAAMVWHGEANAVQLNLTWTDNSDNEDGFSIDRKTGPTGMFAQIATVEPDVSSYTDSALTAGTTYCYRVLAFNVAGTSAYSNEACGTPPQNFSLTVVRAGTGSGTVSSTPAGITCGSDCSKPYSSGTSVTLAATSAAGSTFSGWSGGGCGGRGSCTVTLTATTVVTATYADSTVPTVTITSPTSNPTHTTGNTPLTLGGTAADNVGVTQVTWTNDRGGSGTATGTTSWSASGIVLQPGTNALTVTALDAAGNTATATLTVNYQTASGGSTLSDTATSSGTFTPADSTATSSAEWAAPPRAPSDTSPPSVSFSAPASGATVSGWITVTAALTDNVGVTKVEYYLDGALVDVFSPPVGSFAWDSATVGDGSHTWRAVVSDAAGNTVQTAVTFTVQKLAVTAPGRDQPW